LIDTTVGVENVTWYRTDMRDKHRITITFQDDLRDVEGAEKVEGEIEFFGDSDVVPYSHMGIESPEQLDDLAEAIRVAAQHWRHCIGECDCATEEEEVDEPAIKILSFGGMDFGLWTPGDEPEGHEEEDEPETDPDEDNQAPNG
jgi:hypothetical protein